MNSQFAADIKPDSTTKPTGESIQTKKRKIKFVFSQPKPPVISSDSTRDTQPLVPPVPPASEYGPELRNLNRRLEKALKAGRAADAKKYIMEGAAISFLNYDGILCAAEDGKYKVIEMIFKELAYQNLIDNALLEEMIMSTAPDMMNHTKLHKFLLQYRGLCPITIKNKNLNGFIDDIACQND